jgi:hypothetical protein
LTPITNHFYLDTQHTLALSENGAEQETKTKPRQLKKSSKAEHRPGLYFFIIFLFIHNITNFNFLRYARNPEKARARAHIINY